VQARCTDVLTLDWPLDGAHLGQLRLFDRKGKLISENLYWHARNEEQLQQLNAMPTAKVTGKLRVKTDKHGRTALCKLTNGNDAPALAVRMVLRDADTGERVLPAYYSDNYFSLLPGKSRELRIESRAGGPEKLQVTLDGWNVAALGLKE
jgi:hypothetical protein